MTTPLKMIGKSVYVNNPSAIVSGQAVIAVTGTAVELPNVNTQNGIVIYANASNNAAGVFIGPAGVNNTDGGTGTGYKLVPGQTIPIAINNLKYIYFNGTVGDVIYWVGN